MKKHYLSHLLLLCSALFLISLDSCASTGNSVSAENPQSQPEKPAAPAPVSDNPLGISNEIYSKMMEASVVSTGNNYRLKKVIEKMRRDEQVYVACIGGSVTEGAGPANFKDGYAYQFSKALLETYCVKGTKNYHFNGAGLSGTPSPLGLLRYQNDVVDFFGCNPDLLIIEFAVNDGGEATKQRAFEELIRRVLSAKPDAAVIALYSAAKYPNTQTQMKPVADYYSIPQVSVKNAVDHRSGSFTDEQFFTDIVHPTKEGHSIMKDCLMNLLALTDSADTDQPSEIPSEYKKTPTFQGFCRILGDDGNVKISAGSFNNTDGMTQSLKKTNRGEFPVNWYHRPGGGDESFVMELECRNLIMCYKDAASWAGTKFGKADIYVDGVKKGTWNGFTGKGWNNTETVLVIDEAESRRHTVEVRPADPALGFTIAAMGYTR